MRQTSRRRNVRSLLALEVFLKTACLFFSVPLFRMLFKVCLRASGYSYVTRENLVDFILSPCVLVCITLVVGVVAILAVFEANAVCLAVCRETEKHSFTFPELFFASMKETGSVFRNRKQGVKISFYCLIFVMTSNVPFVFFLILAILFRNKKELLRGIVNRGCFLLTIEAILYPVGFIIISFLLLQGDDVILSETVFLRFFERYHRTIGVVFASVNTIVTEWFCAQRLVQKDVGNCGINDLKVQKTKKEKVRYIYLWFTYILFFTMAGIQTVAFIRSEVMIVSENWKEILITAHRGASDKAPENTRASIVLAVEEKADYAEIDIRMTADKVPVLLHDGTLLRTTGIEKKINNVTYKELSSYNAGQNDEMGFAGEKVPGLKEILEEYGREIKFNIELKESDNPELVTIVVGLIEKYGLEEYCVITSASYAQLEEVKAQNNKIRTGYILSLVYGDFYRCEAADFFSIKSAYVTERVVKSAHAQGKEVHVWTVNTENELKRMQAIGVDNIITDKPAYAREIVEKNRSAGSLKELLTVLISKNNGAE